MIRVKLVTNAEAHSLGIGVSPNILEQNPDGLYADHAGITFSEHTLAHRYLDKLRGLEIGCASHNPWGLDVLNVAPVGEDGGRDSNFYKQAQVKMNGTYAEVDIDAEAHHIPVEADSQDYVISSHVIEHLPDPIVAFWEWTRIIKDGGTVFMIVPLRNAHPADRDRAITDVTDICHAYLDKVTVDSWNYETNPIPGGRRGHYYVYSIDTMKELIDRAGLPWTLMDEETVDTKVGNGFTLVYRIRKPYLEPRDLAEGEMLESVELEMPLEVPEEAKAVIAEVAAELQPEQIVRKKPGRKAKSS